MPRRKSKEEAKVERKINISKYKQVQEYEKAKKITKRPMTKTEVELYEKNKAKDRKGGRSIWNKLF